jgi:Core-2/I-Branching enzyme
MMRTAYFILAHKNPKQVRRLIHRLNGPAVSFYVHIDARAANETYIAIKRLCSELTNLFLTPRYRCYWGGFGIAQATLACIDQAFRSEIPFDYAFLVSGQDYPIKTSDYVRAFLEAHRSTEFMESFPLSLPNRWTNQAGAWQAMERVSRFAVSIRSHQFHTPLRRKFPAGLEPYGGSQWWCLSNACLKYINSFAQSYPKVIHFFKHVLVPDELMLQTIVSNSCFSEHLTGEDLTYSDWEHPNPDVPRILLQDSDLEAVLRSPKLFARKFDASRDDEILDAIDQALSDTDQQTP